MTHTPVASRRTSPGFTLIEMIVVTLLLSVAMLGLLAVFDASARINKSETDVADAQGSVRYGIYQMTRAIRMAGAGGLYVTQAVLNHADASLPGIAPSGVSYDNVAGVTVVDTGGTTYTVRPGTDMIEVRGVIFSPLLGFIASPAMGCNGCTGVQPLDALPIVGDPVIGQHVNDDATRRPQFAAIDAYTATAATQPMLVIVQDGNTDLHSGCSDPTPGGVERYPQSVYNVGVLRQPTTLVGSNTFGDVDFGGTIGPRFNGEMPSGASAGPTPIVKLRRAGILDDVLFFITTDPTTDPAGLHPFLAQGIRRGNAFEVTVLADDVEDMQVAYGIDGIIAGTGEDNALTVQPPVSPAVNVDPNVSTAADGDEWVPNVNGEAAPLDVDFQTQNPFIATHGGAPPARHCPRLHGVMISLLAKARDSDPTYKGTAAQGYHLMNSTAAPVTPGNFRRRVQTLKINLRNYAFQG